jgi:hypothetical protein
MFKKTRKPEGPPKMTASDVDHAADVLDVEQVLCQRLAGDLLANALFVADARLAETTRQDLSPATRDSVNEARTALAHAARSGLVLLTTKKPGLEPSDDIDVGKRMQLATTMLRQVQPEAPDFKVTQGAESTLARIPVGFPSRLLARTIACYPTAREIRIDIRRSVIRGLDSIEITITADVAIFDVWLNRVQELLELVGGTMTNNAPDSALKISLPATLHVSCETDVGNEFIERRNRAIDRESSRDH